MAEVSRARDIVLVVDDSPETLSFLTDALEHSGATVLVATEGARALALVERITPDIILMDAVMPGMDGFETCRRLKANAGLSHVPIIFMTGLSETEHILEGLEAGGVDYVTKPIVLDVLLARIRVHLANARTAQSARMALDTAGRYLLAANRAGAILWCTPQAAKLLEAALPNEGGTIHLPEAVRVWLKVSAGQRGAVSPPTPITVEGGRQLQLSFLGRTGEDEFLFRLTADDESGHEAALRRQFAVTQREAEVLLWIARGKSNRDIGEILGLSPRTVNKHLETIYQKLGVENRASAAIVALSAIGER
ncbi:DNA-binding response OmpR family regulator/DNA-binding CsgD family transcriptional regulator [Kaistia hirudinis]|uniref:DNA-binding response OmpR family regulator/DNA-binding CsgD family transcriptional regulator n=1 Tax=Kaistia hirudinis TaxID=1293440 RepID=A0A840AV12_9HYPH|nr:response regulator transcription factor [Kaistia hirudinis]MBB3932176.1 DNA-binding response OmpR family regulator/DNA-binding CsgD family transcriptional regulator [Kaistia hirudinis]MBN9016810.1 response regulator transcription factor [Hyphomicrobiales bacterium]